MESAVSIQKHKKSNDTYAAGLQKDSAPAASKMRMQKVKVQKENTAMQAVNASQPAEDPALQQGVTVKGARKEQGTGKQGMKKQKTAGGIPAAAANPYAYLDLAHVLASIGIAMISANAIAYSFGDTTIWTTSNVVDGILRYCLPVFFILPIFTALQSLHLSGLKAYYKQVLLGSVLPFLVWSILCFLFEAYYMHAIPAKDMNWVYIVNGLCSGKLFPIFWFFIPMYGIQLSLPLFIAVPKEDRMQVFGFLFAAGTIVNVLIPFVLDVLGSPIHWDLQVFGVSSYLLYVPLTWVVTQYDFKPWQKWLVYGLGLASLIAMIWVTQVRSVHAGMLEDAFKGYTSFCSLVYAFAFMLLMREWGSKAMAHPKFASVIHYLVPYMFAYYLVHKLVFDVFLQTFHLDPYAALYRFGMPFAAIPIVIAMVCLCRKVPVLRRILP